MLHRTNGGQSTALVKYDTPFASLCFVLSSATDSILIVQPVYGGITYPSELGVVFWSGGNRLFIPGSDHVINWQIPISSDSCVVAEPIHILDPSLRYSST